MTGFARLRAEIDIRKSPSQNAEFIERFDADTLVEILNDHGDFLEIRPKDLALSVKGYIPRLALVFPPPERTALFPLLTDNDNHLSSSVPPDLPLSEFLSWLGSGEQMPWISADVWERLDEDAEFLTIRFIESVINNHLDTWQEWNESVESNQRLGQAIMNEWLVILEGGREVFPSRSYYINQLPVDASTKLGWVLKGQVMRWTGQVRFDQQIDRQMYEVDFYRRNRATHGWIREDILSEYVYPSQQTDPKNPINKENIFNLDEPVLRHPQDPEFGNATALGLAAAQYLDIRRVLGRALVHFNLCGEICVAALIGSDVIPLLTQWRASVPQIAENILNDPSLGTSLHDLRSILSMFNRNAENYNSTPVSAKFVKDKLVEGMFPIAGCCITNRGKVEPGAKIRHWVIVTDVYPVGASGWVRIYNPFNNQEEVYEFNSFLSSSFSGTGMWVFPHEG